MTNKAYSIGDGCYATVIAQCDTGSFLKLDNGEIAFSSDLQMLKKKTKVLCTVIRMANKKKHMHMAVSVDSVCEVKR